MCEPNTFSVPVTQTTEAVVLPWAVGIEIDPKRQKLSESRRK